MIVDELKEILAEFDGETEVRLAFDIFTGMQSAVADVVCVLIEGGDVPEIDDGTPHEHGSYNVLFIVEGMNMGELPANVVDTFGWDD